MSLAVVPGLLQTADYARATFASQADLFDVPRDLDEAVRERLRRQEVLYSPDKEIDILISEAALLHPVAPREVMAAQADRLGMAIGLPNVRIGLLPMSPSSPARRVAGVLDPR
ncbi:Scr1 family TA system antitoxin-like transcriptional regulator [Saccharopolyspora soli]|uniref:Scr1 family TA system antitoxin-like transcriptional regulator n=1 Tax=Saccharopolyspora soli TaxID=2926618 RepID=UPI003557071C